MGLQDFWVVKLDAAGNLEWQNTIGGSADDFLYSVLPTPDGGYICGGRSMSGISGDKTEVSNGVSDFWVVKLNATGDILWQNSFGGDGSDDLYELILTHDGGYLTGGRSFSTKSGDKTEELFGLFDYWVVKLDSTGTIQWQNSIGGSDMNELMTLTSTFDNGFLCGGMSQSFITGDKNEICQGHYDYWILKLNSNGQVLWQNTIGGSNMDYLGWIEPTGENDFLCGGFSSSNISGDKTENCSGSTDIWIIKISGKRNIISGTAFADLNSSGIKDPGEPIVPGLRIADIYSGNFDFTDADGFYAVALEDTGNYEVVAPTLNYFTAVPSGFPGSFSEFLETDSLNDFAFKPAGTFNDLCVSSTPVTAFRSGMNATYRINYSNSGTTTLNPTVIFYPDSNLSFASSIPAASSSTQDSLVWNFGPLTPFESGQILVTMQVDSGLPIGTLINSGAVVEPLAGDANLLCNQSFWEVVTTGSYDPNDIMVNRDTLYDFEITSPAFLEYVVRFQNTGNDTAFFVSVNNKIAPGLNLSSFEFIGASHPCTIEYQSYDSTLKFIFNNILLPDSNVNEPGSNGFVRYRIQPHTTLVPGDIISNSADIIFDFNAPVATNSALTEIVLYTSLQESSPPGFAVYPNPVTNVVNVVFNLHEKQNVAVVLFNMYGQKVQELFTGALESGIWHKVFTLENLPGGVYVISVNGSSLWGKRLIKL